MALGTRKKRQRQEELWYGGELPTAPGHPFYKRLNEVLESVEQQLILVLDDYHHLGAETAVHTVVDRLLSYLPDVLHVIIISRDMPPLSLARLRSQGDRANTAWALQALGEVAHEQGDAGARSLMEESLALFREVDDPRGISFALSSLGQEAGLLRCNLFVRWHSVKLWQRGHTKALSQTSPKF